MKILVMLILMTASICSKAQSNLNELLREQLVKDWERAKAYTQEYLDAMPADKYNYQAADSVRSFADHMLHMSQANVGLCFNGTGFQDAEIQKIFLTPAFGKSPGAQTKDSVVYYVNKGYDYAINAVKHMDLNKASEIITRELPGGIRSCSRMAWVMKAFEHQTHHRGQCTIYLRRVGIKPPREKLW